jgi:hypothetical protein
MSGRDTPDEAGASGAYSNSAIAMMPPGQALPASEQERVLAIKIARAMASGPREITKDATVAEMGRAPSQRWQPARRKSSVRAVRVPAPMASNVSNGCVEPSSFEGL